MKLQEIVSSPRTMWLGMFLGRHTPVPIGHRLAWSLAGLVCLAKPEVYRIVVSNLRQVLGPDAEDQALRRTARNVFYFAVRSYYDLYHALGLTHLEMGSAVEFPAAARVIVDHIRQASRGTVLVVPHLGNFDLAGRALAVHLPGLQVLSLPNPPRGFQLANESRRQGGLEVTPLSTASLREAIERLSRSGVVATGGDRPVSDRDPLVSFFGRPAHIPSGAVRLALKTDAQMVVAYSVVDPDTARDTLRLEPPLDLIRTGNRAEEEAINTRRLLDTLEQVIRRWLDQWLMFVPVWPEQNSPVPPQTQATPRRRI